MPQPVTPFDGVFAGPPTLGKRDPMRTYVNVAVVAKRAGEVVDAVVVAHVKGTLKSRLSADEFRQRCTVAVVVQH